MATLLLKHRTESANNVTPTVKLALLQNRPAQAVKAAEF